MQMNCLCQKIMCSSTFFMHKYFEMFVNKTFKKYFKRNKFIFFSSGVSFVSRKYSRIRVYEAHPGPYFVMIEALQDIRNITLEVDIFSEQPEKSRSRGGHNGTPVWRQYSIP